MRTVLDITIHGTPAPQGSKNPWGGEANKRTKPWRESLADSVGKALPDDYAVLRGPVQVKVTFAFTRPKSHYRTGRNAHVLRDDAPFWHTAPNDTDKLQRALGDALTGVVWKDDKQIALWVADKIYDDRAYAHIIITDLSGGLDVTDGNAVSLEGQDPGLDRPL